MKDSFKANSQNGFHENEISLTVQVFIYVKIQEYELFGRFIYAKMC